MSKKDIAPITCPQCGEEKGWRCLNAPDPDEDPSDHPVKESLKFGWFHALIDHLGIIGLFGFLAADSIHGRKKALYHCDKCGYEEKFDFD